jgi:hypothetical protein
MSIVLLNKNQSCMTILNDPVQKVRMLIGNTAHTV